MMRASRKIPVAGARKIDLEIIGYFNSNAAGPVAITDHFIPGMADWRNGVNHVFDHIDV
jgi:hypothetical protein